MRESVLIVALLSFMYHLCLQMRMSVRSGTPVLMPATTPWAPTTALVLGVSLSQLTAGPVRVDRSHTYTNQNQRCHHHYHTSRSLFK